LVWIFNVYIRIVRVLDALSHDSRLIQVILLCAVDAVDTGLPTSPFRLTHININTIAVRRHFDLTLVIIVHSLYFLILTHAVIQVILCFVFTITITIDHRICVFVFSFFIS